MKHERRNPFAVQDRLRARVLPNGRTWLEVAEAAMRAEGADPIAVLQGGRTPSACRARDRAWYELRADETTVYSFSEIGAPWGYDHSSVMEGIDRHEARLAELAARAGRSAA